jgi:vWA domain found in the FtsH ternary systems/N-terminal helical region fused to the FtsH ternary system vWA domain
MISYELRDLEEARRFLLQGLWWQRAAAPTAATVRPALEWALQAASVGLALPPLGFIADLGRAAFGLDGAARPGAAAAVPALPINLMRTYEDHVLGKLYADWSFTRAAEALRRYEGRDRARGLAFVLSRFKERSGFDGVHFSPGVLKGLLEAAPEDLLRQGWESLRQDGVYELNERLMQSLIVAARRTAEVLGPDDVAAVEAGDALADEGEQVARRQVRQAAAALEAALPRHGPRPQSGPRETPTLLLEEDAYPVGGFSSLSTRGSVESLLHSQLAYMETDERPDLFDMKFLRDELLYYSRDENQFFRRRRTFVFVLQPDLTATRFKDAELPYQRGVLLLALMTTAMRKLTEWLSADALAFEVLFVGDGEERPLGPELALLKTLLREPIADRTVTLEHLPTAQVAEHCADLARRSQCCCLVIAVDPPALEARDVEVASLRIDGPRPVLAGADAEPPVFEADDAFDAWALVLERLLRSWV